jgi:hypothetical protein
LAPRALSPKWTSSIYLTHHGSWCIGLYTNRPSPSPPIHRRPLRSGVYSLLSRTQASSHELITIAALPCPPRPHWTKPMSRAETLEDGRNFGRLVGLHQTIDPGRGRSSQRPRGFAIDTHNCGCRFCLRDITVRMVYGMLLGIMSILASMPIHTF